MSYDIDKLQSIVLDRDQPIENRVRAAHDLWQSGNRRALSTFAETLYDESDLLAHESAFYLGQIGNKKAIEPLQFVLLGPRDTIVRHAAGEAIGAIGNYSKQNRKQLKEFVEHDSSEIIKETCELALERLRWLKKEKKTNADVMKDAKYNVVDPAIPLESDDINQLKQILLDNDAKLSERYGAMLTLRNIGNEDAVEALLEGLKQSKSALHRHQIAFTLGQLGNTKAADVLLAKVKEVDEHQIVRHESIRALGRMGMYLDELEKFVKDSDPVISETAKVTIKPYGG